MNSQEICGESEKDGTIEAPAHVVMNVEISSTDPHAEARLVKKLDWSMVPLFTLIYMFNFVDRTNVGNAKIAGLLTDLHMTGNQYNVALTIFYVFYIVCDIPSNLALKQFGAKWMAFIITVFGILTFCHAFLRSYASFVAIRVLLGITESGTLSGLAYMLSRYYTRDELVLRIGIFFGLSPTIAGAFGGLLASALLSIPDFNIITGWRKIFFVEGLLTILFGLACFVIIPDDPERTKRFLSPSERQLVLARIALDRRFRSTSSGESDFHPGGTAKEKTTLQGVLRTFSFSSIVCTLCYIMCNIAFQGLALFIPTVVASLGHYTTVEAQLRSVPPYIVGAAWALLIAFWSFRVKNRALPIVVSTLVQIIGYAIAIGSSNPHARYASIFFSFAGPSPTGPLFLTWGLDNSAPETARATAAALFTGWGAVGSIIAVWSYLPSTAPSYRQGNILNVATSCTVVLLTIVLYFYLRRENKIRDTGRRDHRLDGKTKHEEDGLGHRHPGFRYQL